MLKEVVNLMGPVIDVGDLPEGRGFAIAREGKSICVTGLSEEQTREFGKLMGNFVAIQIHAVLNEPAP